MSSYHGQHEVIIIEDAEADAFGSPMVLVETVHRSYADPSNLPKMTPAGYRYEARADQITSK